MERGQLGRSAAKAAFWLWAVLLFTVATSLTAAHLYALPKPAKNDLTHLHALNGLRAPNEQRAFLAVHVLYAQCRCSRKVLEHLAAGARPTGVREKALIVGSNPEIAPTLRKLSAAGFQIVETSAVELRDRFHVQAAPLFVVLGPDGTLRYSGGYTQRKQGPNIEDRAILDELMAEKKIPELPVFGCAVSRELQRLLDPFALRSPTP